MRKKIHGAKVTPVPAEVARVAHRILAADSDLNVELDLPPDANIHFLGQPIAALNPALNNGTLPAKFLNHSLIRDRYFFALPQDIWEQIYNGIGEKAFDDDLVELECAATRICGNCSFNVGLRSGGAFPYALLRSACQGERRMEPKSQTTWTWSKRKSILH